MSKFFSVTTFFSIILLVAVAGCQSADPEPLAALPTVAQVVTIEPTEAPLEIQTIPATFTPMPAETERPTQTPLPPTAEPPPTEEVGSFSRGGESMPSLLPEETPLPTITASPSPTLEPAAIVEITQVPGLPPFETGPVNKQIGGGFGYSVRNNDRLDYVLSLIHI